MPVALAIAAAASSASSSAPSVGSTAQSSTATSVPPPAPRPLLQHRQHLHQQHQHHHIHHHLHHHQHSHPSAATVATATASMSPCLAVSSSSAVDSPPVVTVNAPTPSSLSPSSSAVSFITSQLPPSPATTATTAAAHQHYHHHHHNRQQQEQQQQQQQQQQEEQDESGTPHFAVVADVHLLEPDDIDVQLHLDVELDALEFIRCLPPCPDSHRQRTPLLPPKSPGAPPLTLVLDLDETLVHCSTQPIERPDLAFDVLFNNMHFAIRGKCRPFLKEFFAKVSSLYEVVLFTASQAVYAERVLACIDPDRVHVRHALYRESCVFVNGNYLKDLHILGRDLSKTIIIDNAPQCFGYHPSNGLPIRSWYDDPTDNQLLRLADLLVSLAALDDVRPTVRKLSRVWRWLQHYGCTASPGLPATLLSPPPAAATAEAVPAVALAMAAPAKVTESDSPPLPADADIVVVKASEPVVTLALGVDDDNNVMMMDVDEQPLHATTTTTTTIPPNVAQAAEIVLVEEAMDEDAASDREHFRQPATLTF
ncbi:CTD small phosphatase-like protein 2 [Sorochytrium milnesiophthora]